MPSRTAGKPRVETPAPVAKAGAVAATACAVCRELLVQSSFSVEEELPAAAKSLRVLRWSRPGRTGYDGCGFSACRRCGAYYYRERDHSTTGSDPRDFDSFYLLAPDEVALLEPLLARAKASRPGVSVARALDDAAVELLDMNFGAGYARACGVLGAVAKAIAVLPAGRLAADLVARVRAFAARSPENARLLAWVLAERGVPPRAKHELTDARRGP